MKQGTSEPVIYGNLVYKFKRIDDALSALQSFGDDERAGCFTFIVFLMPCDLGDVWLFHTVTWVGLQFVIVIFYARIQKLLSEGVQIDNVFFLF